MTSVNAKKLSVELIEVNSSNIARVGFDKDTSSLFLEYKGGNLYVYSDVSLDIYNKLMSADSVGRFVNEEIKGTYDFVKAE